jgi:hypothetical protein
MNELMTVLGKEIFRHQMTKGELFEANTKIQSLEAENERLNQYVITGYETGIEELKKENDELRSKLENYETDEPRAVDQQRDKLEVAVVALRNWLTWEDEQVKKDGAYVRSEINELIKNGKQALETIMAQDDQ